MMNDAAPKGAPRRPDYRFFGPALAPPCLEEALMRGAIVPAIFMVRV